MSNVWDRQENEPLRWYARYEVFRLRGPGRSFLGAYNQWRVENGKKVSTGTPVCWQEAAKKWRWKERAEAWDLSELEIRRQQEEQRWRERRIEQKDKEWAAAQGLLEKANQMMQALRVARTVVEDEGRTIIIEPVDWGPSDLARFLDLFSKLGRLSAEMETEKRKEEITGKDGGPIVVEDSLTPEERKRRLAALLASLEKKEG
jgi:hypothetical protein